MARDRGEAIENHPERERIDKENASWIKKFQEYAEWAFIKTVATLGSITACSIWNEMLPKGTLGDLFSKTMKALGLEKLQAELAMILEETI